MTKEELKASCTHQHISNLPVGGNSIGWTDWYVCDQCRAEFIPKIKFEHMHGIDVCAYCAAGDLAIAYSNQRKILIDDIIKELRGRIDVTNTLPEQQRAYKHFLDWIENKRQGQGLII